MDVGVVAAEHVSRSAPAIEATMRRSTSPTTMVGSPGIADQIEATDSHELNGVPGQGWRRFTAGVRASAMPFGGPCAAAVGLASRYMARNSLSQNGFRPWRHEMPEPSSVPTMAPALNGRGAALFTVWCVLAAHEHRTEIDMGEPGHQCQRRWASLRSTA